MSIEINDILKMEWKPVPRLAEVNSTSPDRHVSLIAYVGHEPKVAILHDAPA